MFTTSGSRNGGMGKDMRPTLPVCVLDGGVHGQSTYLVHFAVFPAICEQLCRRSFLQSPFLPILPGCQAIVEEKDQPNITQANLCTHARNVRAKDTTVNLCQKV